MQWFLLEAIKKYNQNVNLAKTCKHTKNKRSINRYFTIKISEIVFLLYVNRYYACLLPKNLKVLQATINSTNKNLLSWLHWIVVFCLLFE